MTTNDRSDLSLLRSQVAGPVRLRHDSGYDAARADLLWNARQPEHLPDAIVDAQSAQDVRAVVQFAAASGIPVTARSGGHHWSGVALRPGIVVDLSRLDHCEVNVAARTASVGPAVTNQAFAAALAVQGMAFPVGHCPTVTLGGYLLGGGLGWNMGAWGVACHGVVAVQVVMPDGAMLRASADEHPDVFWAARGAGPGFFGIVTEFELRLQPLPAVIVSALRMYPLAALGAVEQWITEATAALPPNVEVTVMLSAPPEGFADSTPLTVSVIATAFADSKAEVDTLLGQVGAGAPEDALVVEAHLPTPFGALFDIIEQSYPEHHRYAADTFWSTVDPADFLTRLAADMVRAPSKQSLAIVLIQPFREARPLPDSAFSMTAPVYAGCYAIWADATDDAANLGWLHRLGDSLAACTVGHYLGEANLERSGRMRNCFSPAAWERLQALQARFDPAGLLTPRQRGR